MDFKKTEKLYSEFLRKENDMLDKITFVNSIEDTSVNLIVDFISICPHEFTPYIGKVEISLLTNKKTLGFSEFFWIVDFFSKQTITQEDLNQEIYKYIKNLISPKELSIKIEATHTCKIFNTGDFSKITTKVQNDN